MHKSLVKKTLRQNNEYMYITVGHKVWQVRFFKYLKEVWWVKLIKLIDIKKKKGKMEVETIKLKQII